MTNNTTYIARNVNEYFRTRMRLMVSGNNSDAFNMCRKYTAERGFEKDAKRK